MRSRSRLIGLLLAWLFLSGPAWAIAEIPAAYAVLRDADGSHRIDTVQQAVFTATALPVSPGYTSAITWLRIVVPPSAEPRLALLVQPQVLDEVWLYARAGPGDAWVETRAGDLHAYADRARGEVQTSFDLVPSPTAPTTVYLRIASKGTSLVRPRVLTTGDSVRFDAAVHGLVGLYAGLVFALMAMSLLCWLLARESLWGFSALFHAASLVYAFFVMGFAARFAFPHRPEWADAGTSVMGFVHFAAANLAGWTLLRGLGAPGWTTLVYRVPLAAFPLLLAALATGHERGALAANALLVLAHVVCAGVVLWFVPLPDRPLRWMLRGTALVALVYLALYVLPLLGLGRAGDLNVYPALPGNLLTAVLYQLLLARRAQLQLHERRQLQFALRDTATRLETETQGRREAASFLDMLVHEVKNPLAAIRVAALNLRREVAPEPALPQAPAQGPNTGVERRLDNIQRSVADIDAVLQHCLDLDRLQQGRIRVERAPLDIADLLRAVVAERPDRDRVALDAGPPLQAAVDAGLLRRMLRNLLDNALRYSPPGATVSATLAASTADDGRAGFAVTVRNPAGRAGLPAPERLFTRYYRSPQAQHIAGTGLGLYWVHEVAALWGGAIGYRPDPARPHEAVFVLWLPR